MLTLTSRIEAITGKSIKTTTLPREGHRYPARIHEIQLFINKLSPADLALLIKRATFSLGQETPDHRSFVIPLERPIELEGKMILALRLKGVFPQDENGTVKPHTEGPGFVPRLIEPTGKTIIRGRNDRSADEFSALGTMSYSELSTEVETAIKLGTELTDLILGFGFFEELSFNGKPVGFAIYGIESKEDDRLINCGHILMNDKPDVTSIQQLTQLFISAGSILRQLHNLGIFHHYPHLANFRQYTCSRTKILDLDNSQLLAGKPIENLAAYYIDLTLAIREMIGATYNSSITNHYPWINFLPYFFGGYFNDEKNDFLLKLSSMTNKHDANPSHLARFCLTQLAAPRIDVEGKMFFRNLSPAKKDEVDLTAYKADYPLFASFYDALEQSFIT